MRTSTVLTTTLASLAVASPIVQREDKQQNNFEIANFVYGCTVTCDWSFDVVNTNSQLPGHPGFTQAVTCKGSKGAQTSFDVDTCGPISSTERVAAYIDNDSKLNLQYRVSVPGEDGAAGATYWFEGEKEVGAATGYNPSPPSFSVPESKASAIA